MLDEKKTLQSFECFYVFFYYVFWVCCQNMRSTPFQKYEWAFFVLQLFKQYLEYYHYYDYCWIWGLFRENQFRKICYFFCMFVGCFYCFYYDFNTYQYYLVEQF
ncbi:hypothetical protein IMG5_147710 [Ichthyophthirius multifiliis]|uniref:Transmembrane protein n=1 Tax=Ichthyophthirius multifiliis TaxID=5932 RepID=G0QY68_ICHMU|nr:hypothetical protein IMG5_147710 [Ichthyophthirius multifiliis]EGR29842.1 hypothetical protein IMG5_147710 [Ichthyophthirius multifiliis]|eukprot:XP_004031078.1 hypothetical protein IMG5_147710 [Ichthyophthirius multifiliis]